jgi:hypothetical protein
VNQETCAVLTAVFPIVMLTVAVERRSVHVKIGRLKWFRKLSVVAVASSFAGLLLVLAGVQTDGLENLLLAITAWLLTIVSVGVLTVVLISVLATAEVDEDSQPTTSAEARNPVP